MEFQEPHHPNSSDFHLLDMTQLPVAGTPHFEEFCWGAICIAFAQNRMQGEVSATTPFFKEV